MFAFDPLTQDDLPFLIEIRNECRDSLHDNRVFTLAECQHWFREVRPDFHVIRYNGERIGYFRLSNHDPVRATIYVGADLHEKFRGRGLARLAYESFLPVVKSRYGIKDALLEVLSHNTTAHALYLKLGFRDIDRKVAVATRNGRPVDSIIMSKAL